MNDFGERTKSWSGDPTPSESTNRDASSKDIGTSMNAISFGFAATAILVSMFLIMAIFEHLIKPRATFLRPRNDARGSLEPGQPESQNHSPGKPQNPPLAGTSCRSGFSVLMPGQQYPTFLAQPAPLPCPREGIYWPPHDHR
ncbi:uncharacterized protein LOC103716636 [Phoenix dactylifera]|uniref:Uncharacterized protein LOC103716636 n=1 Tax=Phoenix dactylifera TaxID=42345 RepID=A0A8B8JA20_PHODC|nr:uncharacterized protein LOC103716636 [Phoenix dactylifera]